MDKNIIGTLLTISTILGTFIYSQGVLSNKIKTFENDLKENQQRIYSNQKDVHELKNGQIRIETTMQERFDKVETLILEM